MNDWKDIPIQAPKHYPSHNAPTNLNPIDRALLPGLQKQLFVTNLSSPTKLQMYLNV